MAIDLNQLGLIYYPNSRCIAYLDALRELGIGLKEIIVLSGPFAQQSELVQESIAHGYDKYYDCSYTLEDYLHHYSPCVYRLDTQSVNHPEVRRTLESSQCMTWLFGGGGILKPALFQLSKDFIHIHPGIIPNYRGSTCWYYSLLEQGNVGATAFYMTPEIDDGEILASQRFVPNVNVESSQVLFMDHILDPFIRASVLKLLLRGDALTSPRSQASDQEFYPYFVAHTVLRLLATQKLNRTFDPNKTIGIIPKESFHEP